MQRESLRIKFMGITLFWVLAAIFIIFYSQTEAQGSGQELTNKSADKYRKLELGKYTFEVPLDWEVGGPAQEQEVRRNINVDPGHEIQKVSVVRSGPGRSVVIILEIRIPSGKEIAYIDNVYSQSIEKLNVGRSQGTVKEVSEIRKTRVGRFDALLIDWEATRGSQPRMRQWSLHTTEEPNDLLFIIASCTNRDYTTAKDVIDRIASSLTPIGAPKKRK